MKGSKKSINLKDHKNMMELMKQLYGNYETTDDDQNNNTKRESGAKSVSEVAELPPNCS